MFESLGVVFIIKPGFGVDSGREWQMNKLVMNLIPHGDILSSPAGLQRITFQVLHYMLPFDVSAVFARDEASSLFLYRLQLFDFAWSLGVPGSAGVL